MGRFNSLLAAPMNTTQLNYRGCFWLLVGSAIILNVIGVMYFSSFGLFDDASWGLWAFIGFAVYSIGGALYTIVKHFNKVVWIEGGSLHFAAWKPNTGILISDIKTVEVVDLSIRIETATETRTISRLIVSGKDVLKLLGRS